MKNRPTSSDHHIKRVQKDDLEIVIFANGNIRIHNYRNGNLYFLSVETHDHKREISFTHLQNIKSNLFCTEGFSFSFRGNTYTVDQPGDSVNVEDGSIACCIRYNDMQEILEKIFYVPNQERVYDFMNEKFLISLL